MGKKAKKGRKKDRRDSAAPTGAESARWAGRSRLAPELWSDAVAPVDAATVQAERVARSPVDRPRRRGEVSTSARRTAPPSRRVRRAGGSGDASALAARLASLSTILGRELARADLGDGLTRARLSALALLVLGGPRRLGELAAAERVRPPTMTRLVRAMEADGWVERTPDPVDRRSIVIRATAAGEARLEQSRRQQLAPLAAAIEALDPPDRRSIGEAVELLERLLREGGRPTGPSGG
jgi:DNA-binding MarR family transcriptional regulator